MDNITLALAKAYVNEKMSSVSGVKGDKGDKGDTGTSVANVEINDENHLIITLSDSSTIDAGLIETVSGKDGSDGKDGTNATITGATATVDANVGTPSATVTTGGTASARTFDFVFKNLKGEKGDTGEQGIQGIQGEKGDKGDTGKDGTNGKNGTDGTSLTAISFTKDANGEIIGGTATLSDDSTIEISNTTATVSEKKKDFMVEVSEGRLGSTHLSW